MLRSFIQISAIIFTLEASWFLLQGNLGLSINSIAEISSTKLDYNADVIKTLSKQRADSWVGFALLLLAFLLQLSNALWEMRWQDFSVNKKGAVLSIIACAIIFVACFFISKSMASNTEAKVTQILQNNS
ncbi:MAG: hypothetical protein IMF11_01895 [Proteobacteria bacterium]|nr:hypothetical protein [Pseudomonadota bacterium]